MIWYIIALLASFYAYHRIRYCRKYELGATFPGPLSLPIIGNAHLLLNRKPEDGIRFFANMRLRYGGIFRIWVGMKLAFYVSDARIAEVVLSNSTKHLTKHDLYDFLVPWLGDGLLLSRGRKWHNRRKMLTPAFHFKILEQFVHIFDKQSRVMVELLLQKNADGKVFDVQSYVTLMALDVVCEAAMGTQINAQTNTDSTYVRAVHDISKILALRFSKLWQRNDFLFKWFASEGKYKQDHAIRVMHDFTKGIIKKRRQQLMNEVQLNDSNVMTEDGIRGKMALLDVLLMSSIDGIPLSDDDIQEEVDNFMFAGHDTTTSAISFTLWLLSRHKDVQDKLFAELQQVLGSDRNSGVSYRQLQDLKYMELVIKESMRMYPPVPNIGRKLEEETKLNERFTIPADSNFNINLFLMFRDPAVFSDPDTFHPERFIESNTIAANPYAYIPFSAGSRNCLGQKFAMLEMKSTISKVLRHFELLPVGETPIPLMELILRSKNGVQLGLRPR